MGFMSVYGFIHGNVNKLLAPIDGNNQFCGVKNDDGSGDLTDYPYLYIGNLNAAVASAAEGAALGSDNFHKAFATGVCVKTCPKNYKGSIKCECKEHTALCDTCDL